MKELTATAKPMRPMMRSRLGLGLTQQALADECEKQGAPVTDSQISKIERGLWTPRPKLRRVLADILELDIDDLAADPEARSE